MIQSDVIICVKSFLNEALSGMLFPAAVSRDSSRGRPGSHNATIGVLWVGASDVVKVILSKQHQHAPNGARHSLKSKMLVLMP